MRFHLSASLALLCLAGLPSCSSLNFTKGDLAALKLRDLTRFGQPHVVKVSPTEVQQMDQAELKSGRVASLSPSLQASIPTTTTFAPVDDFPVNYVPPSLPNSAVGFDGSILPPKTSGGSAVLDIRGSVPGQRTTAPAYPVPTFNPAQPQNFSIE